MLQIEQSLNSTTPWYAVHCKHKAELYTANMLRRISDLVVFLPEYTVLMQKKERKKEILFPGYLFIQADLKKVSMSTINATPGVISLISFAGEIEPVPPSIIRVIYEQVIALNNHIPRQHPFQVGDLVHIKNGSLQDLELIFMGQTSGGQRVNVLMNILGRLKKTQIDPGRLGAAQH